MNRFTTLLVLGAAFALPTFVSADCGCGCDALPAVSGCGCDAMPAATGCGCEAAPACNTCNDDCRCKRTRTRLKLVRVCKDVCRTQRVCTTDCCGCPTTKRVRVKKSVSRLKLVRVEVQARERCCRSRCSTPCNTCAPACPSDPCSTGCGCN